jgi:hypothetical protein
MAQRRQLLEKNLLYLFSADVNVEYGRQEIGFVPGGVRINILSQPQESRVYHVAGETRLLGDDVVSGTIAWGGDWALAREDDLELLDLRLLIRTDDGAVIEAPYQGMFAPGPRSFRQLISEKPRLGSEQKPFEGTVFLAPCFRSDDARYRWLNGRQCVGLGRIRIIDSVARQASLDFWMMD